MKNREESLEKRAKEVLGLAEDADIRLPQLKKSWRKKAKENHPDQGGNEEFFKLILESKRYLEGESDPHLLENDKLVEKCLGYTPEELGDTYREWRLNKFYDLKNKSIWP